MRRFPAMAELARHITNVLVEAYLTHAVREGMSGFTQPPAGVVDAGLARLADDLRSGRWTARFGALRATESADLGYRVVIGLKERSSLARSIKA